MVGFELLTDVCEVLPLRHHLPEEYLPIVETTYTFLRLIQSIIEGHHGRSILFDMRVPIQFDDLY